MLRIALVPLIILFAVLTFICWLIVKLVLVDFKENKDDDYNKKMSYLTMTFIFERAISILVVSCPCAFGLAIPTVTTISLNKALNSGILIKNLSIPCLHLILSQKTKATFIIICKYLTQYRHILYLLPTW